jgi:hypothetical protein
MVPMALEGPQLRYARVDEVTSKTDEKLARALRLAQMVEEMLDETPMARAMAASLVDELETLVRGGGARSSRSA